MCDDGSTPSVKTVLIQAIELQDVAKAKSLILDGADVNYYTKQSGWNALHYASWKGLREIVETTLHKHIKGNKFNINARTNYGETALSLAASEGHEDIVELLVEYHADINLNVYINRKDETHHGQTALIVSASRRQKEVVKRLLDSGASLDCRDWDGWTLLDYASYWGWTEIEKHMVLYSKYNINGRVVSGKTPLMLAVNKKEEEAAKLLLMHGADVLIKDYHMDQTVLTLAIIRRSSANLISLLVEKGAYFKSIDYEKICNDSVLKEQVLKNRDICIQAIVNEYNIVCLPAVKKLRGTYNIVLPSIKLFQINGGNVLREIEKMVDHEIETQSICNVMKVRPLVLQMMTVRSLLDYHYCQ